MWLRGSSSELASGARYLHDELTMTEATDKLGARGVGAKSVEGKASNERQGLRASWQVIVHQKDPVKRSAGAWHGQHQCVKTQKRYDSLSVCMTSTHIRQILAFHYSIKFCPCGLLYFNSLNMWRALAMYPVHTHPSLPCQNLLPPLYTSLYSSAFHPQLGQSTCIRG